MAVRAHVPQCHHVPVAHVEGREIQVIVAVTVVMPRHGSRFSSTPRRPPWPVATPYTLPAMRSASAIHSPVDPYHRDARCAASCGVHLNRVAGHDVREVVGRSSRRPRFVTSVVLLTRAKVVFQDDMHVGVRQRFALTRLCDSCTRNR